MKRSRSSVLSRYERAADGHVIIDVAATRLEDLYNDFDRTAPYNRRDLDQDLVDYLIDCATEIGGSPFRVQFSLMNPPMDAGAARVRQSMRSYFLYLAEIEWRKIRLIVRQSWMLFGFGLFFLFTSFTAHQLLEESSSIVAHVFAEGLTIAGWVSMWHAVAIYLIDWFPHHSQIQTFRRLAGAELLFRTAPPAIAAATVSAPIPERGESFVGSERSVVSP